MSYYTKGPWLLEKNLINGNVDIVSEDRYFIISTTIDSDIIGERIDKANAKLIAAAPDLLEALKEIIELTDRKHTAWYKAKAAIAKAVGQ